MSGNLKEKEVVILFAEGFRFVGGDQGEQGMYMLQDTHGLNGIHPAAKQQSIIQIPEKELHSMSSKVWFVQNRALPVSQGSFLDDDGVSQALMLEKFWNSHGYSYSETFHWTQHQEPKIKEMLQKQRALITLSESSWQRVIKDLPESPPGFEDKAGHTMVLDRFDSGYYLLKNSWGPTGGSPGATDGKVRIPEGVFNQLEYYVHFLKETHSTHTTLAENGWMWAVATLSQTKQGDRRPLQEIVEEVENQLYTYLTFSKEYKLHVDSYWKKISILQVAANFFDSKRICMKAAQKPTIKERLKEREVKGAIILFADPDWKTMVSKFTNFHKINGDESDPGQPQLVILRGFVRGDQGEEGIYMLQDTHGLNGIHPAAKEQSIIQIPEKELDSMSFAVWVENRALPVS